MNSYQIIFNIRCWLGYTVKSLQFFSNHQLRWL